MIDIGIIPNYPSKFLPIKEYIPPINGKELRELLLQSDFNRWRYELRGEQGLQGILGVQGQQGLIGNNAYLVERELLNVTSIGEYVYKLSKEYFQEMFNKYSLVWISYWDTRIINHRSTAYNQIEVPLIPDGVYDFIINWGDGNLESVTNYKRLVHDYSKPGVYKISIVGKLEGISFRYGVDNQKLLNILNWGCFTLTGNLEVFANCINLNITAIDLPIFKGVTNLSYYFVNCTNLVTVPQIREWDWDNITEYNNMFLNCINLTEDISFLG